MNFEKTFEEELNAILTDYRNQPWVDPETGQQMAPIDTSVGSMVFLKAVALASAKWGLHRHQAWIAKQIYADDAETANLEHHCYLRGIYRNAGESNSSLLSRLLADLREPEAGGNAADYSRWAKQVENVSTAWSYPLGNGFGTVDVLILADSAATGSEIPDQTLLDAVHAHIHALNPAEMAADDLRILAPTVITQDVTMTISGIASTDEVETDIYAYMSTMTPGQGLHPTRLASFAIALGESGADVSTPSAPVTAGDYQVIRPGNIIVAVA